jgi:hypothetical protein
LDYRNFFCGETRFYQWNNPALSEGLAEQRRKNQTGEVMKKIAFLVGVVALSGMAMAGDMRTVSITGSPALSQQANGRQIEQARWERPRALTGERRMRDARVPLRMDWAAGNPHMRSGK